MARNKIEVVRHIRYNWRRAEKGSGNLDWYFLIVNQNREIERTESLIFKLMKPIQEEIYPVIEESISGGGLRYKLLNFESRENPPDEILTHLHLRTSRDRDLYRREDSNGLEEYLASLFIV